MTGKQLQQWRDREGVSQGVLARAMNMASATVYRWEKRPQLTQRALRQVRAGAKKLKLPFP